MILFSYQNLTLVIGCIMKTLVTTQLLAPHHLMDSPNHCHTTGAQIKEGLCYTNSFEVLAMCNGIQCIYSYQTIAPNSVVEYFSDFCGSY